jgi:hypothetical protein
MNLKLLRIKNIRGLLKRQWKYEHMKYEQSCCKKRQMNTKRNYLNINRNEVINNCDFLFHVQNSKVMSYVKHLNNSRSKNIV